jgi:hypothetical protein
MKAVLAVVDVVNSRTAVVAATLALLVLGPLQWPAGVRLCAALSHEVLDQNQADVTSKVDDLARDDAHYSARDVEWLSKAGGRRQKHDLQCKAWRVDQHEEVERPKREAIPKLSCHAFHNHRVLSHYRFELKWPIHVCLAAARPECNGVVASAANTSPP